MEPTATPSCLFFSHSVVMPITLIFLVFVHFLPIACQLSQDWSFLLS